MTTFFKRASVAVAACALILAGCATQPEPPRMAGRSPAQPPIARIETPEPAGLVAQASVFEAFMRHARRIDPAFGGPSDVAQALQTGASHEPHELEAGMIAYAALAALQEPRFVAAARTGGSDLARRIAADPQAALILPGADAAEARARGALYAEGAALSGEGEKVKHAAYAIQRQAWAKAKVPDAAGRLSRVKRLSTETYQPAREDPAELQMSLAGAARRGGAASPVVARGVALAALSALGEARQGRSLMSEPRTTSCLHMAKLNLYQCLASAGPNYEDVYCLGQHAMIDPGQCVVEATQARQAMGPQIRSRSQATRGASAGGMG
ncbi:MAG TPA: hypothetical protein VFE10_12085 [Phenylobacterium sp.]|jgi:predicted small secreted protein|nr:hypothetical protein [Phenylobacterium sp.]